MSSKKSTRVRLATLPIESVLPYIVSDVNPEDFDEQKGSWKSNERKFRHEFERYNVKVSSLRLRAFKKSITCSHCNLEASFFAIEKIGHNNPSLELYGCKTSNSTDIPFCKNLIIPLEEGGVYCVNNVQTLCLPCSIIESKKKIEVKEGENYVFKNY